MIIITGLGRCGSTLMTLVFKELGFALGKRVTYGEIRRAGMENAPAYSISRDMYIDYLHRKREIDLYQVRDVPYWGTVSLRDRILMLDNDTPDEGKIEIFKDPRITWDPKIIRSWWQIRKDLKLIILHRKPEDIIKSRQKVSQAYGIPTKFEDPMRGTDVKKFYEDYNKFMIEVKELGIPYVWYMFPDFVDMDLEEMLNKFKEIDIASHISVERFKSAWIAVFDRSKISNFGGGDEVIIHTK